MAYVNFALCALIWWLGIARITKMTGDTQRSIRWSVAGIMAGATAMALAPIADGLQVHWSMLLFEASNAGFLLACRRLWTRGTPNELRRGPLPFGHSPQHR